MPRSSKLSEKRRTPEVAREHLFEIILTDVIQTAAMPYETWSASNPSPFAERAIPVSSGGRYQVTQAGMGAALQLTEQLWTARGDLRQTIGRERFNQLSFTAIGDTVLNSRDHLPTDASTEGSDPATEAFYLALSGDYVDRLNRLADQARLDLDRHIPCDLFHADQAVPAFSIGPVAFLPRAEWIDRFVSDPIERGYVRQIETRSTPTEELRQQALEAGHGPQLEVALNVMRALQAFAWVATIRMSGHELSRSHDKASILVGLAIDALGLRFQVDDARRFAKAGRQHLFSEERLATRVTGGFLRGTSIQMPGLGSRPGALAAKLEAERPFLEAAGKILAVYHAERQSGRAPHLVERWINALYWVGEARREASDFMAVVNYGCAADGLSGAGGNATEMTVFAEAALSAGRDPTPQGQLSIADAVTAVYREGRNKLAHGEAPGLLEDLAKPRAIGDALLLALFDVVTPELANIIETRPQILQVDEKHAYRALRDRLQQRSQA